MHTCGLRRKIHFCSHKACFPLLKETHTDHKEVPNPQQDPLKQEEST